MVSEANPGLVHPGYAYNDYSLAVENALVPGELGGHMPPPPHGGVDSAGYGGGYGNVPPGATPQLPDSFRRHWVEGTPQQHAEPWYRTKPTTWSVAANAAAGTALTSTLAGGAPTRQQLEFRAKSLRIDNPTPYMLLERESLTLIPPFVAGYQVNLDETIAALEFVVAPGSASSGSVATVYCRASERPVTALPVQMAAPSNSFAGGNSGASLGSTSVQLNEGGVFAFLRGVSQGANGTALDGAAAVQPVGGTPLVATSGANASVTLTIPAVANQKNYLLYLAISCTPVSSAAAAVTVVANGVTWTFNFPSGGLGSTTVPVFDFPLPSPLASAVGGTIAVTVPALGAGVVATINALVTVG